MSVFYHNDDPLLHQTLFQNAMSNPQTMSNPSNLSDAYAQLYKQQLLMEMKQQQQQQQQNVVNDWVGELDKTMKSLDNTAIELLNSNTEFSNLNAQLQSVIQGELISLVKININTNQGAVDNIKKQIEIMNNTTQQVKNDEKQNMNELNDYLKNYSHLTFNEYKRLKNGLTNENVLVNGINEEEVISANDAITTNNKKSKKN